MGVLHELRGRGKQRPYGLPSNFGGLGGGTGCRPVVFREFIGWISMG
jgi:hypothetical protein